VFEEAFRWESIKVTLQLLVLIAAVDSWAAVRRRYPNGGSMEPPQLNLHKPGESATRLSIWLGLHAVQATRRASRLVLNTLYEASAEVGEWSIGVSEPSKPKK
jgi:hypothetical protein